MLDVEIWAGRGILSRMDLSLVVLAAGIGSRYEGLKQMDPVGPSGEFIFDYSVHDAIRAGFDRVVFVINAAIEDAFRSRIGGCIARHVAVEYVVQDLSDLPPGFGVPPDRTKPWGTAHAVLATRGVVKGPFGVINADDFYGRESYKILADFLRDSAGQPDRYAMVGFVIRNTVSEHGPVSRGICRVTADGGLAEVVERTGIEKSAGGIRYADDNGQWHALSGDESASMNIWGFKPLFFDALAAEFKMFLDRTGGDLRAEFFLPFAVNSLVLAGKVGVDVLKTTSSWFGITYPADKPRVVDRIQSLVDAGEYPEELFR